LKRPATNLNFFLLLVLLVKAAFSFLLMLQAVVDLKRVSIVTVLSPS
jgi:hypothetical protein